MEEKTIKGMKKDDLVALVKSLIDDINRIYTYNWQMENIMAQIKDANRTINGDEEQQIEWLLEQIQTTEVTANEKMERIQATYELIMVDEKEAEEWEEPRKSILSQLNILLDEYKNHRDDIETFSGEVFGYENTEGKPVEWLQGKLKKLLTEQEEKYKKFFARIERELDAGTTSLQLAKTFSDKVIQYSAEARIRWYVFIGILVVIIVLWYISIWIWETPTIEDILLYWLYRLPLVSAVIWLAIFVSNRRAEAKKLEESYKHKEVMARSFMGYKDSIKQLQQAMWTDDFTLLTKHMDNLLDSIATDSSKFLIDKWEKHPFIEVLDKALSKTKLPKSLDELIGKYSVTAEFKKE